MSADVWVNIWNIKQPKMILSFYASPQILALSSELYRYISVHLLPMVEVHEHSPSHRCPSPASFCDIPREYRSHQTRIPLISIVLSSTEVKV